jgi:hypothetical protein
MERQGKQMRVGAREAFACHWVKLVLFANGNRYEVDSNAFSLIVLVKPSIHLKYRPMLTRTLFGTI